MAGMGAGYDLSVSTFSPDGRVFQVEYACKAVDSSGLCLAAVCTDGILFAVEKAKPSPLLLPTANRRIYPITSSMGMAVAGLAADGRQIVSRARSEAEDYRRIFGVEIPAGVLAERIGLFVHVYSLYWSVRPFGAGVLLGSIEKIGQEKVNFHGDLYCIDPSGCCSKFVGTALGKGNASAKTELEKMFSHTVNATASSHVAPVPKQTTKEALLTFMKIFLTIDEEGRRGDGTKRVEVEAGVLGNWDGQDLRKHDIGSFSLLRKEEIEEAEAKARELLDEMDED